MIKKGIAARVRPALDLPAAGSEFRQVFQFARSWKAIVILAVFDVIFIIPIFTIFNQAVLGWSEVEDLFDLVTTMFSSAWLLGWSIAPLVMTSVLLLMIFGREVVRVRGDVFELFIGLPLIGLRAQYSIPAIRNLQITGRTGDKKNDWRGDHLQFDYGANSIEFGSKVSGADLLELEDAIRQAGNGELRVGEATPEELEGDWKPSALEQVSGAEETVRPIGRAPLKWSSPTALMLILANLVPVAGTVYLGWNLGDVMVLYWAESAIVGFFNVLKLIVINRWMAIFSGTFFIAHFGAFMAVHFLFIWGIFVKGFDDASGDLNEVARHFISLWPALLALFVSHGLSFFRNFIGRREYRHRTFRDQMGEPYTRIALMHFVLIIGGGVALALGSPTPVLLIVIAGKTWFDLRAHIAQRDKPD